MFWDSIYMLNHSNHLRGSDQNVWIFNLLFLIIRFSISINNTHKHRKYSSQKLSYIREGTGIAIGCVFCLNRTYYSPSRSNRSLGKNKPFLRVRLQCSCARRKASCYSARDIARSCLCVFVNWTEKSSIQNKKPWISTSISFEVMCSKPLKQFWWLSMQI